MENADRSRTEGKIKNVLYFIYILYCQNNTYYTGYTNNLVKRIKSHFKGNVSCKYTRSFKPLYMAQLWTIFGTKRLALQIESHLKQLTRNKKEHYIAEPQLLFKEIESTYFTSNKERD